MKTYKQLLLLLTILATTTGLAQRSEQIARVVEYRPAPGQHINRLFPTPEKSESYEKALAFAQEQLVNKRFMLGLGSFGGYVIVAFDHPVVNVKGQYDLRGMGNAFVGNSEPGVVLVCQDRNKNGKPDPEEDWYELAGSEYKHPLSIKNYEITYYRPKPDGQKKNIRWTDNQGGEGEIQHISFATQASMYPRWIKEDQISFRGTKLRNNARQTGGFWKLEAFDWGYVDNHPNTESIERTGFKIDWAVNAQGKAVQLDYIDFVKIHTAQLQEAGSLGETSTEITGMIDLHPNADLHTYDNPLAASNNLVVRQEGGYIKLQSDYAIRRIHLNDLSGRLCMANEAQDALDIRQLPEGLYLIRIELEGGIQLVRKIQIGKH